MVESKDVNDAEEKEDSYVDTVYIYVDNVSEKKQKKWSLKNTHKKSLWRLKKNYVKRPASKRVIRYKKR